MIKKLHSFLILCSLFIFSAVHAGWGPYDYVMSKNVGDTDPTIVASWGAWTGKIGIEEYMYPRLTHELVFEFESPNYFSNNTDGHFAVGVRANYSSNALEGQGIIIGNVTGYPLSSPCSPTSSPQAVAIEQFYGFHGTCVYGSSTETGGLQDNVRYRVQLTSQQSWRGKHMVTRYKIWEKNAGSWDFINHGRVIEEMSAPAIIPPSGSQGSVFPPIDSQGMFFDEVLSSHAWTMNIYNMTSKTCVQSKPYCSNL